MTNDTPFSNFNIRKASTWYDLALCIQCRTRVFVAEQDVPPAIELDQHEDVCMHYLAVSQDGESIATLRWRITDSGVAKIERLAVLPGYRGYGIGRLIMEHVLADLDDDSDIVSAKLNAQDHSIPFYEKLGFARHGQGFMEAGIPHHTMFRACMTYKKSGVE